MHLGRAVVALAMAGAVAGLLGLAVSGVGFLIANRRKRSFPWEDDPYDR